MNEVSNSELVARTLLVFWVAGCASVLVDFDHFWKYSGLEEPINFTGWIGRPFHYPVVFGLFGIICAVFMVALVSRWNVSFPVWSECVSEKDKEVDSSTDRETSGDGS